MRTKFFYLFRKKEKNINVKFLRAECKQRSFVKWGFLNFYHKNWFLFYFSRLLLDSADWAFFLIKLFQMDLLWELLFLTYFCCREFLCWFSKLIFVWNSLNFEEILGEKLFKKCLKASNQQTLWTPPQITPDKKQNSKLPN